MPAPNSHGGQFQNFLLVAFQLFGVQIRLRFAADRPAEHRDSLPEDSQSFTTGSCAMVLPLVELKSTFNVHRPSLSHASGREFRLSSNQSDLNERGLFRPFPGALILPAAVNGNTKFGHRCSSGGVPDFRVAGDVSCDDDNVEAMHGLVLVLREGWFAAVSVGADRERRSHGMKVLPSLFDHQDEPWS